MRTLLICHDDAPLDREGLARWLGSFTTFAGTLTIREARSRRRRRIARELERIGWWRFLDVVAFRAYHRLFHSAADRHWLARELSRLRSLFPDVPDAPELIVSSPNSVDAERFIRACKPDLVIARCKTLLKEQVFSIPRLGTFVMHPGICPEYRNAHGCFWAIANGDLDNVGATLLRIDAGIDTGPVYGYYRIAVDPGRESHRVIQHRAVLENLDAIRDRLLEIESGVARPVDTSGRGSSVWGQPWMSAYFKVLAGAHVGRSEQVPKGQIAGLQEGDL